MTGPEPTAAGHIACQDCGKTVTPPDGEPLDACPFCGSVHFHYFAAGNPIPMNFSTKDAEN